MRLARCGAIRRPAPFPPASTDEWWVAAVIHHSFGIPEKPRLYQARTCRQSRGGLRSVIPDTAVTAAVCYRDHAEREQLSGICGGRGTGSPVPAGPVPAGTVAA